MNQAEILQELFTLRKTLDHFKAEATKPEVLTQDMTIAIAQCLLDSLIAEICTSVETALRAKGKIQ